MKRLITFTFLLMISSTIFAQRFDFGINVSSKIENYSLFSIYNKHKPISLVPSYFQFTFGNVFDNNFEISTGVAYYTLGLEMQARIRPDDSPQALRITNIEHSTVSIPIMVGYHIPVGKRLYFKFNTGFEFDFASPCNINQGDFGDQYYGTVASESDDYLLLYTECTHYFNVMLTNSVSFHYITKFNMYFGVQVAYHTGLRMLWKYNGSVVRKEDNYIINDAYSAQSNGSYFQFGITLGYRLEKKK